MHYSKLDQYGGINPAAPTDTKKTTPVSQFFSAHWLNLFGYKLARCTRRVWAIVLQILKSVGIAVAESHGPEVGPKIDF